MIPYPDHRKFQSTLPRGERQYHKHDNLYLLHFNPRSHEGSDGYKNIYDCAAKISIHAPTRGATKLVVILCICKKFQSTLPRGERRSQRSTLSFLQQFQSTLPRGERQSKFLTLISCSIFQSTLPRGERRLAPSFSISCTIISIHAPTRGAT